MTGWTMHLFTFLAGIGVGAGGLLLVMRNRKSNSSRPDKTLRRLYKECPEFFDNIRGELGRPEFQGVREFAIVQSAEVTFVSEGMKFVYYESEISNLKEIAAELEESGFVDDVTRGKTPLYRMRESFVTALSSL